MKKALSLLIALSMALSIVPFGSVLAADTLVFSESFENGYGEWTLKGEEYADKIWKL